MALTIPQIKNRLKILWFYNTYTNFPHDRPDGWTVPANPPLAFSGPPPPEYVSPYPNPSYWPPTDVADSTEIFVLRGLHFGMTLSRFGRRPTLQSRHILLIFLRRITLLVLTMTTKNSVVLVSIRRNRCSKQLSRSSSSGDMGAISQRRALSRVLDSG